VRLVPSSSIVMTNAVGALYVCTVQGEVRAAYGLNCRERSFLNVG
jgi:hypothetical protein